MSFHTTYSAKHVITNYAGVDLSEGRPEDVFLTITESAPRASFRKGVDGNTAPSLSTDHSATVTLTFFPQSNNGKLMTALYYSLKQAAKGDEPVLGAFPLVISDPSGSILIAAPEAVLMNKGDNSFGNNTGEVSFEFYVEDVFGISLPEGELADTLNNALGDLGISI